MQRIKGLILVSDTPNKEQHFTDQIISALEKGIITHKILEQILIKRVGHPDMQTAPANVIIYPEAVAYGPITPNNASQLIKEHYVNKKVSAEFLASSEVIKRCLAWLPDRIGTIPVEQRIVLERIGHIDPDNIEDYIIHAGYKALGIVLHEYSPGEVISLVEKSGLRGRGGAGFPTGVKWGFVAKATGAEKFIICNADESEPGTYKDRVILEGDPHAIIEAMAIAGYAIHAQKGIIYIRGEYGLAQQRFRLALQQAYTRGFLGCSILGTNFNFDIQIHTGAGAYICGEETALIESIEGKRGEPRSRPPYPTTNGLWGKPTLVNNVETLANIPAIIRNGPDWFRSFGTISSPGTKIFTVLGNVNNPCLIELSMGITLREIIWIYGGGLKGNKLLKFIQTGGTSGAVIPACLQDIPMDFDAYAKAGVSLGSGAILVFGLDSCIVETAKVMSHFFRFESCGKCTPCRIGTRHLEETLGRISTVHGQVEDIVRLETIAGTMNKASFCGLGQTAPTPVATTLKYFKEEYLQHAQEKFCCSAVCTDLYNLQIKPDSCTGCQDCIKVCPTNAIFGSPGKIHAINLNSCNKCNKCINACKFHAIHPIPVLYPSDEILTDL